MSKIYDYYPYLTEAEDRDFARCFRLTEDELLSMYGGLKAFTEHRLNRAQARGAAMKALDGTTLTFEVPKLPSNTEEAMSMITIPGLSEKDVAAYIVKEQMDKVSGIMGALRANAAFKAMDERRERERQSQREADLRKLADIAAGRFGWSPDSQSAKDWAAAELARRGGRL